jgi:hypothetical protein
MFCFLYYCGSFAFFFPLFICFSSFNFFSLSFFFLRQFFFLSFNLFFLLFLFLFLPSSSPFYHLFFFSNLPFLLFLHSHQETLSFPLFSCLWSLPLHH